MKYIYSIFIILIITSGFKNITEKVTLKIFAEEAIQKKIIGTDPIIVINQFSTKIYSKIDLKHSIFKNLNRKGLFIIPKNSDLIEEFWGEHGKKNGAIVFVEANE